MVTIVEPKAHIYNLWGKQSIDVGKTYRLMKYLLQFTVNDQLLLHNVVTGHLIALSPKEAERLRRLPSGYSSWMEQFVMDRFLVPEGFDEHHHVAKLRVALYKVLDSQQSKDVTYYTILPTTACNARCWYCFEKNVKPVTMSEKTAEDVVSFISSHCGGKPITIRWFGGEPTLAIQRINQICEGLRRSQIKYSSLLTTNGYLLDEDSIAKAKTLWNLKLVTISVDGTEENYNRVKSFKNITNNPYKTVLRNIELLLKQKITVGLRMNFDQNTYQDFPVLLREVSERFKRNPYLHVYAHHLNIDYSGLDLDAIRNMETWYNNKLYELNKLACHSGLYEKKRELPCLYFKMCEAAIESAVTITPLGDLVSCAEQIRDDEIKGNIHTGVTNKEIVKSWKCFADNERCWDCELYPACTIMARCNGNGRCYRKTERLALYQEEVLRRFC